VIRNGDVTREGTLRGFAERFFSPREAEVSQLLQGDIALTTSGDVGKAWLVDAPGYSASNFVRILRPDTAKVLPPFLRYALESESVADALRTHTVGTTIQNLQKSFFEDARVALPPIADQRRLVGILDEAFEGIASAEANAEKNLENARTLFESHLQSVFTQRGKGWVEKPLGECFRLKSGDSMTSKAMVRGPYPVYGGNGVAGMHNEFNLSGDNVIIGRVGALCGNARHITEKIWLTDNAFRLVDFSSEFDNGFLSYLLNYKDLRSLARQAAQPVISNSSLKDLPLSFPGLSEQREIGAKFDALSGETQRLAHLYERKLAALAALKKSLLHQAFTGNL